MHTQGVAARHRLSARIYLEQFYLYVVQEMGHGKHMNQGKTAIAHIHEQSKLYLIQDAQTRLDNDL